MVNFLRILIHFCMLNHIDPLIAESIIKVESNWKPNAIGLANEIGLFQLNPTSFNYQIDYLSIPNNNIKIGVKYLAKMKKDCSFQENYSWLICYNRGITGALKVKNYTKDKYYIKVMFEYNKLLKQTQRVLNES